MVNYFDITYFLNDKIINHIHISDDVSLFEPCYILKKQEMKDQRQAYIGHYKALNDPAYDIEKFRAASFLELVYFVLNASNFRYEENVFYLNYQKANKILFESDDKHEYFMLTKTVENQGRYEEIEYSFFEIEYKKDLRKINERFFLPTVYFSAYYHHVDMMPLLGDYIDVLLRHNVRL